MSDAIRKAFEEWYISEYGTLGDGVKFHGKFGYPDIVVDTAWKSWEAALSANGGEKELLPSVREYLQQGIYDATHCEDADQDHAFAKQLHHILNYPAPPSVAVPEEILTGIRDVLRMLGEECGDTDPLCDPEDMREAYPLIWGHQQLFAILGSLAAPQPDHSPDAGKVVPEGPIPALLYCPECGELHVDEYEWAKRPHKTHQCQSCGCEWRPFSVATVGIDPFPAPATDAGKVVQGEPVAGRVRMNPGARSAIYRLCDSFEDAQVFANYHDGVGAPEPLYTHPAESSEEIRAQALEGFRGKLLGLAKPLGKGHWAVRLCQAEIDRLRASQQEGNTAGDGEKS